MKHKAYITLYIVITFLHQTVLAFNGHTVTEPPLTISIDHVDTISQTNTPIQVTVNITNTANTEISAQIQLSGLLEEMEAIGESDKKITIPSNNATSCTFTIQCSNKAYSALYPIHIFAEFENSNHTPKQIHAVRIIETQFSNNHNQISNNSNSTISLPFHGSASLLDINKSQVQYQYFNKPINNMPLGWKGSDPQSGTFIAIYNTSRPDFRRSLAIHPPWKNGIGTAFLKYFINLPETKPIKLSFANAIRDNSPTEPASDGVTFRVWVNNQAIFDKHTDSKTWQDHTIDLSSFAGQNITLKLESHPGPAHNTTCDTSYWAQPIITTGPAPKINSTAEWSAQRKLAADIIQHQNTTTKNTLAIPLKNNHLAAIVLGPNGIADASIAIGQPGKHVIFNGFNLEILNQKIASAHSGIRVTGIETTTENNTCIITHAISLNDLTTKLIAKITPSGSGLKISFYCPERLTDISLGTANQTADRIYYGHGYCIENPQPFQAGFGGHNLSTSHVGFDFSSGISLLTATDNPPDMLIVNPDTRTYALHTHMNATLTLVPSSINAFDAAIKYRPLYDKQPAPAFKRKAGRFVFDIWGGRYAEHTQTIQKMLNYGLTDTMLTLHVWQRWGYDYRLPDIYPPNPDFGSLQDMQQLSTLCRSNDIPWGLHDNYIDFYPDAQDYNYKYIAFTPDGSPIKAWINEGRDAQSYRWRPDQIQPFVERNLKPIKENIQPTHYFIDVFTSINMFDFYENDGTFHSSLETRKYWGQAFSWIRDYLGGSAIMTSEAGDDQLTGCIEGADCQFLSLSNELKRHNLFIKCKNWQRVPWYDTVLHDKFSLHGVGYSNRYQGGQSREHHGIESDDYISAEILTGHSLMIDLPAFGQGAIRKYYLAQDFIQSIATDTIKSVEFIDDNIHHQKVAWNSGGLVYVNRSDTDWNINNHILPPYGYIAENGPISTSIEKINDIIIEQSTNSSHFYVNARGYGSPTQLEITPTANRIETVSNNSFKLFVDWKVSHPGPKDAMVFIHFEPANNMDEDNIVFQGDFKPAISPDNWPESLTTGKDKTIYVPADIKEGLYNIYIGLWSPSKHIRYKLRGNDTGGSRYLLGTLDIQKSSDKISAITLNPINQVNPPTPWGNLTRTPVNFGPAQTSGAFRCEIAANKLCIIPLPELQPFEISLNLQNITGKPVSIANIYAITPQGKRLNDISYSSSDQWLSFTTQPDTFAYEIQLK